MVEPLSWALAGSLAAQEGIKFLYAQFGELLKALRQRKAGDSKATIKTATPTEVFPRAPSEIEMDLVRASEIFDEVELLALRLERLSTAGAAHATEEQAALFGRARGVLEDLSGVDLSLKDEPARRPVLEVEAHFGGIAPNGKVTLAEAKRLSEKHDYRLKATVAGSVEGEFKGAKLG